MYDSDKSIAWEVMFAAVDSEEHLHSPLTDDQQEVIAQSPISLQSSENSLLGMLLTLIANIKNITKTNITIDNPVVDIMCFWGYDIVNYSSYSVKYF